MAKSSKSKVKKPVRRKFGWIIGLIITAILLGMLGWSALTARVVHVRRAEVRLADLPASLDGTTILFLTDLDVCGTNTAAQTAKLIRRLQELNPDVLLLGGDYASANWLDRLNGKPEPLWTDMAPVLSALTDFRAPMGKLAIAGDNDGAPESLALKFSSTGVQVIDGKIAVVTNGTDAIGVAGVSPRTENVGRLAAQVQSGQCVIALTHSPEQAVDVRINEAGNGGPWADLILSGHTHGGQARLFGRTALTLTESEKSALSGWKLDGAPMLTSQGLGCEAINLRWDTQAEAWLITLRTKSTLSGMEFTG